MKRIILFTLLLILLFPLYNALSEQVSFNFTYYMNNKEKKILDFGLTPDEICEQIFGGGKIKKTYFDESQLPFWSDPSELTSEYLGYSTTAYSVPNSQIFFQGQLVNNIVLYCADQIDENGINYDIDLSQLYMVKVTLSSETFDKATWDRFIDSFTGKYGKPKKDESSKKIYEAALLQMGQYIINGGKEYILYNRVYTWNGAHHTGIRISADYNDEKNRYENIMIFIGKTDMDSLLKAGKKNVNAASASQVTVASGLQVTVEKKTIALRDEHKKTIQKLEVGTVLEIVGYDHDMNMFTAIVVDGSSSAQEKVTKVSFDGYVYGDNLSVSRAELLEKYKD